MTTARRFRALFRSLVAPTLAGSALVACSSGVSRDGLTTDVCTKGTFDPIAGVTPKTAVDFLSINNGPDATGTRCATARDAKACLDKLQALVDDSTRGGFHGGQVGSSLIVFTRGDEVGSIATPSELAAFVAGTTPQNAALLAWGSGQDIKCGEPNVGPNGTGFVVLGESGETCGGDGRFENRCSVDAAGNVHVDETDKIKDGDPNCAIGRRPEGLARPSFRDDDCELGAWLARIAHLEAASVPAFERLARELELLGAPAELVERAKRSAKDEVRHARVTARFARSFGAEVPEPEVAELAPRSLFDVSLENAIEGCVRETFGALVATYQAAHATDARLRAAMRMIARDETRHAALAWDVAAWAEARLTDEERAEITAARAVAELSLRAELAIDPPRDAQSLAGMPDGVAAVSLFDAWQAGT
jgi:hypothetical protein